MRVHRLHFALVCGTATSLALLCAGVALADPAGQSQGAVTDPASPAARAISDLFWQVTVIAFVVGIFVEALIVYTVLKFGAGRAAAPSAEGDDDPGEDSGGHHGDESRAASTVYPGHHGNQKIEILIFVVTAAAFALLVVFSMNTLFAIETPPENAPNSLTVEVTGSQWAWSFRYPAEGISELSAISEMHVPVDTVVRLDITATDVLHAVWIPDLGVKVDAVPGRWNHQWFTAEREGRFLLQCAEFCGGAHGNMHAAVVVESKAVFDAWVAAKQNPPPPPPPPVLDGDHISVTLEEYRVVLERPLNINLGANVTFHIRNNGTMTHALAFEAPYSVTSAYVDAGSTLNWSVVFDQAVADAMVFCPIPGHAASGMSARFSVSQQARIVDVYLHDSTVPGDTFSITPGTIDLTPGERVVFRVHNNGTLPHNLKLGEPYNVVSPTISGGETTFTPPITVADASDSYWCDIPGHRKEGMVGEFAGEKAATTGPQLPGFEAAWALPAVACAAGAMVWRRERRELR